MFKLTKQMIIIIIIIVFSVNIKANENTFNQCVNDNLTQQQTTKTQIKRLDCSNRQLNEYPNLKEFTSLKSIDLSNNNIIKFTNLTSNLNLKNLDLSGNIIYYLSNDINKLTKLESLKLNSMHLLEISNINKLVLLKNLELSNNQLFIIPSLVNNPLNRLKITNNFLNASNIKSKNKSFIVDKQQNLHLKTSILKIDKNKELFTFQEKMQRIIVSNNNIPLIGLNKYTLRGVQDSNGTNIKLSEYLDISNKNTYKNGVLTGYINLELTNYVIETNAKVVVNISGNSVIIGDDPEEKEDKDDIVIKTKIIDKTKVINKDKELLKVNKTKLSYYNDVELKEFDGNEASKYYQFTNVYVLNIIYLSLIIVPLMFIVFFAKRLKKVNEGIEDIL